MPILSPKRQITLPKELCDRINVRPGDDLVFFEHKGRITILKKTKGKSDGSLKNLKGDPRFSDEESLQDSLEQRRARGQAKRRVA